MLHDTALPNAIPVQFDEASILAEFPAATPALVKLVAELRMTTAFLADPSKIVDADTRMRLQVRLPEVRSQIENFPTATVADIGLKAEAARAEAGIARMLAGGTTDQALEVRSVSDLTRLGEELEKAWANERAAVEASANLADDEDCPVVDAAVNKCAAIVDKIEELTATTMNGLRVKALAISWCQSGQPFTDETFSGQATTNVRLASSIMRDLLASGGTATSSTPPMANDPALAGITETRAALLDPNRCPLPAPGSPEAMVAFKAAIHEHTLLSVGIADGYPELKRTPFTWWTAECLGRALETAELSPAEVAHLYPLATERELRLSAIGHRLNLGALHALAFTAEYPPPPLNAAEAPITDADPILEAIEETKRLEAISQDHERRTPADQELSPEGHAAAAAVWKHVNGTLLNVVPRTAAGCVALARFVPPLFDRWGAMIEGDQHLRILDLIARSLQSESAVGEAASAVGQTYPEAIPLSRQSADPPQELGAACAWVVEHRASWDVAAESDEWGDAQTEAAMAKDNAVITRAIATPALTVQALWGKARLALDDFERFTMIEVDSIDDGDRLVAATLQDVVAHCDPTRGPFLGSPLADQMIAVWREWSASPNFPLEGSEAYAALERLEERQDALIDQAEALPPSLEALVPKALAAAWITYGVSWHNGNARDQYATDARLCLDIDTAICGRLKTEYQRHG